MKRKISNLIIVPLSLTLLTGCGPVPGTLPTVKSHTKVTNIKRYNFNTSTQKFVLDTSYSSNYEIHYFNDSKIPYVEVENMNYNFLSTFNRSTEYKQTYYDYVYTIDETDNLPRITNVGLDSYVRFDFENQSIRFNDYNEFTTAKKTGTIANADIFSPDWDRYIVGGMTTTYEKEDKNEYVISLSKYNLTMYKEDNKYYIPEMLVRNVFKADSSEYLFFNGSAYYVDCFTNDSNGLVASTLLKESSSIYCEEYMDAAYQTLLLTLDLHWGLEKRYLRSQAYEKNFFKDGVNERLKEYKKKLISLEENESNDAFFSFVQSELDDGYNSYYCGLNPLCTQLYGFSESGDRNQLIKTTNKQVSARENKGFDIVSKTGHSDFIGYYSVIDDVAFITMDKFVLPEKGADLSNITEDNYGLDSVRLINYSNEQIRNNSNIKNIVIDLSCCNGGDITAEAILTSWLNKGTSELNISTKIHKGLTKITTHADINLDGSLNEHDYLADDKNIYCIISGASFGAANATAVFLDDYTDTKFIGTRSSGGACFQEQNLSNPFGGKFSISGNKVMVKKDKSTKKYVSIDDGVFSDFIILEENDFLGFYNRSAIVEKIKEVN